MTKDRQRLPTTIGSELAVLNADGELLGYVGETQQSDADERFYARPLAEGAPLKWFASKDDATAYIKGLA